MLTLALLGTSVTVAVVAGMGQDASSPAVGTRLPGRYDTEADQLLRKAVVPVAARGISRAAGMQDIKAPAASIGCSPVTDVDRFWVIHGSSAAVNAFLTEHPGKGLVVGATGDSTFGDPSRDGSDVIDVLRRSEPFRKVLEFSIVGTGENTVLIRADALVVPKGASCFIFGSDG